MKEQRKNKKNENLFLFPSKIKRKNYKNVPFLTLYGTILVNKGDNSCSD